MNHAKSKHVQFAGILPGRTGRLEKMNNVDGRSTRLYPICTDPNDQWNPVAYGDLVVWWDHRNDNWDIYSAKLEREVIPSPSLQNPDTNKQTPTYWRH